MHRRIPVLRKISSVTKILYLVSFFLFFYGVDDKRAIGSSDGKLLQLPISNHHGRSQHRMASLK